MVKIKYANNPNKLQSELKEITKVHVVKKILHEIKNKKLLDYTGEIESVGKMSVGDQIKDTHITFRNFTDCESYMNAFDEGYVAEDAIFSGCIYKIESPQFNLVNRSQYCYGSGLKHEIN